jgi:hypothetical protein
MDYFNFICPIFKRTYRLNVCINFLLKLTFFFRIQFSEHSCMHRLSYIVKSKSKFASNKTYNPREEHLILFLTTTKLTLYVQHINIINRKKNLNFE